MFILGTAGKGGDRELVYYLALRALSLYYCITVLVYYCITIIVLLYYCISVLLYDCSTVLVCYCIM